MSAVTGPQLAKGDMPPPTHLFEEGVHTDIPLQCPFHNHVHFYGAHWQAVMVVEHNIPYFFCHALTQGHDTVYGAIWWPLPGFDRWFRHAKNAPQLPALVTQQYVKGALEGEREG